MNAPQVSQSLIGYCTRMLEAVTITAIAAIPISTPRRAAPSPNTEIICLFLTLNLDPSALS